MWELIKCESINLFNKHFKIKKIYAFEANENLNLNNKKISNTTFIFKGVGEKIGRKIFNQSNFRQSVHSMISMKNRNTQNLKKG